MHVLEVLSRPTADEVAELVDFVESVTADGGVRPVSDHLWLDLRAGGSDGFLAAIVRNESGIVGMAQISAGNDASSLEAFARPGLAAGRAVLDDVAETALDAFAARDGGRIYWWVDDPDDADTAFAATHGLGPERALFEMRRPLPYERRSAVDTRAFVPGADDEAWLRVNNRAFADHGEQGGWTSETLQLRLAEPWFDPDGFRLHEVDGELAAFCWTKLHDELDPIVGEIYVIAADPAFHGRGLGRELTLAGLDSISDRGVRHANLYVDAENVAAVGLYERLGFTTHRRRQAFAATL